MHGISEQRQTGDRLFTVPNGIAKELWIVALASLFTSALYFWHFGNIYYPDSPSYIVPAKSLLTDHAFNGPGGAAETFRTPGYPVLLALFVWAHLGFKSVVAFQHLLRILIILGTTVFTFNFTRNRRLALLTAAFLTVDFLLLEAANSVLSEMLFTVALASVYWLLWDEAKNPEKPGRSLLMAGILAGAAVLIRPVGLYFFAPGIMFLALVRPRYKFRAGLLFLAGVLCLPLAWAGRNLHTAGDFTVSTVSSFNLLQYRAAGSLAAGRPGDFHKNIEAAQRELEEQACAEMQRTAPQDCSRTTLVEKSPYYSRLAFKVIRQHPTGYLKASLRGGAVMMLDGGPTTLSGLAGTSWPTGMRLLMIYTLPILGLAIYGLFRMRNMSRSFFWLAVTVMGYFALVSSGPEAYGRFRVPFLPLYMVLAAAGLDAILAQFFDNALSGRNAKKSALPAAKRANQLN